MVVPGAAWGRFAGAGGFFRATDIDGELTAVPLPAAVFVRLPSEFVKYLRGRFIR